MDFTISILRFALNFHLDRCMHACIVLLSSVHFRFGVLFLLFGVGCSGVVDAATFRVQRCVKCFRVSGICGIVLVCSRTPPNACGRQSSIQNSLCESRYRSHATANSHSGISWTASLSAEKHKQRGFSVRWMENVEINIWVRQPGAAEANQRWRCRHRLCFLSTFEWASISCCEKSYETLNDITNVRSRAPSVLRMYAWRPCNRPTNYDT